MIAKLSREQKSGKSPGREWERGWKRMDKGYG